MKACQMFLSIALFALVTGCANLQPEEKFVGAEPGADCKALYKEHVNQNLCNLVTHEG